MNLTLNPNVQNLINLDALLAEGEQCIPQEGTLDGDEANQERCERRAGNRKPLP